MAEVQVTCMILNSKNKSLKKAELNQRRRCLSRVRKVLGTSVVQMAEEQKEVFSPNIVSKIEVR